MDKIAVCKEVRLTRSPITRARRTLAAIDRTKSPRGRISSLPTDALVQTRNSIAPLLEEYWAAIAWELAHARKLSDLSAALKPFRSHSRSELLFGLLLEGDREKAKARDIRFSRKARHREVERTRDILQPTYEASRLRCRQAVLALDELLLQNNNQPRAITDEVLLDKVFESFWQWSTAKTELAATQSKIDALGTKLRRQEVYFTQAEMLRFIRERRYELTPRNFAAAFAGLPYMSYRQSISRCGNEPFLSISDTHYRLLKFVARVWNCRDSTKPDQIEGLFQTRIEKLRNDSRLRDYLLSNIGSFKRAVASALQTCHHPRQIPYLITTLFEQNLARPKTQVDVFLDSTQKRDTHG